MKQIILSKVLFLLLIGNVFCQKYKVQDTTIFYKDSSIYLFQQKLVEKQDTNKNIIIRSHIYMIDTLFPNSKKSYFVSSKSQGILINRKREGLWLTEKQNVLYELAEYKRGRKNGIYRSFYDNGDVRELGTYENDFKIGEWIEFYNDNKIMSIGEYYPDTLITLIPLTKEDSIRYDEEQNYNDMPDLLPRKKIIYLKQGQWYYYAPSGLLMLKEYYERGKLLKKEEFKN